LIVGPDERVVVDHQHPGSSHELAVAGGVLLANVITAFAAEPIGGVSDTAKYTHNGVGLVAALVLLAIADHRQRSAAGQQDLAHAGTPG
jgi:hypothetical protein